MILQPAQPSDVFLLEAGLRPEDQAEVREGWQERVVGAIKVGGAFTGWDLEGNLVGIGGVSRVSADMLVPWLLCTHRVAEHRASVWRLARRAVATLRASGKHVFNTIPVGSPNIPFVNRLGFRVAPPIEGEHPFFIPRHV